MYLESSTLACDECGVRERTKRLELKHSVSDEFDKPTLCKKCRKKLIVLLLVDYIEDE